MVRYKECSVKDCSNRVDCYYYGKVFVILVLVNILVKSLKSC